MTTSSFGTPEEPYPPSNEPTVGDIIHLPTGTYVTAEQMLSAATDARVVYVGETHDNPASHRLQLQILTAMAERYPGQVSLGMEMFNTAQQPVLDRWSAGELDEKTFLKESAWHTSWRIDFDYYRDLLLYARNHQIPVIGLNATKELVKAVGETPLEELPAELRDQLPEMNLDDPYQRAMNTAVFADHAAGNKQMERFQKVQTLWDEMMATKVVEELDKREGNHRMVVLAGGNHVRFGYGIPRRVFVRHPVSYTLIGGRELVVPEEKQDRLMDIDPPDFPMTPYDYLLFTEYESLPGNKVKLGVRMKEAEDGRVIVEEVVTDSSAEQAGVLSGDILARMDDTEIKEMFDLIFEIGRKQEGDKALLVVERNGEQVELTVTFQPMPKMPMGMKK